MKVKGQERKGHTPPMITLDIYSKQPKHEGYKTLWLIVKCANAFLLGVVITLGLSLILQRMGVR
jgi:hypothetical protein